MSHHSGFSSASRMEIERLNQEAAKSAADMAAKDERLAAMEAMLAANGLLNQQPVQALSHIQNQAGAQTQAQARSNNVLITPSRKRHSSQQLGGNTKGSRFSNNPFNLLNEPESFMDQSCNDLNPSSVTRAVFEPRTSTQVPAEIQKRSTAVRGSELGVEPIFTV